MFFYVQTARKPTSKCRNIQLQGDSFDPPPPLFLTNMIDDRRPRSQPRAISDEGFDGKAALVG